MDFVYDCNLNIDGFVHMLDDPTECYKFYWLDSLMDFVSKNEQDITFDKVITGMIADAWYSVTVYHLKMGTKDASGNSANSIERAVNKIDKLNCLDYYADRNTVITVLCENSELIANEKKQIIKNVPYRALASFFPEIGGNDIIWDQKTRLISYMNMVNNSRCLPYLLSDDKGLNKKILIDKRWNTFFIDNMVSIRGWIQNLKVKYLQKRNPEVPGIIYKLEPQTLSQRKLQNVRKLWNAILKLAPIKDIYSLNDINIEKYEVDHFVPRSYIANDEIWNLLPMEDGLNSSKRNKLPEWSKYFSGFAGNQFTLNRMIYQYDGIRKLVDDCKRDNLNSLWPLEELYLENIEDKVFEKKLESHLKPIYDSASIQGYSIWEGKKII